MLEPRVHRHPVLLGFPSAREKLRAFPRNLTGAVVQRPWWQQVLVIALAWFFVVQLAGIVGTEVLVPWRGWGGGAEPAQLMGKAGSFEGRFVRWDSSYYLQIALNGYRPDGDERAFFPLYSFLSAGLSSFLGLPLLWSGLFVSVMSFVGACFLLYQWVLIDYCPRIARWTVVWACCFPMSFFFLAFYSESLFLLLSIASLFLARRGRFLVSGLAIALAGATRPYGFLLAVPYIIEFWQQRSFVWQQSIKFVGGAVIAPLGTLSYMVFLGVQAHNMNLFSVYQSATQAWQGHLSWPWVTFVHGLDAALFGTAIEPVWFSRALVWQDLVYALFGLVIAVWGMLHLRLGVAVYLLTSIVFFWTTHGPYGYAFWSMPRHVAILVPIYLSLGLLTLKLPGQYRYFLLVASISLLGLLSAWFASGRWVA